MRRTKKYSFNAIYGKSVDKSPEEVEEDSYDDTEFEDGWEDEAVKSGLLLIGMNSSDKSARDNQNQMINEVLKEASLVQDPTKPRYIGAKKLKQAKQKTAERVQPLKWELQGDGATEEEEIIVTKALKEALHRAGYDTTFTGKGGLIDKFLSYGNGYRLFMTPDPSKTNLPVIFKIIDNNNLWMSTNATSFRNGNKNITQLVALFQGTMREFEDQFPQYADKVRPGCIPRAYSYKDLDQTQTQKYAANFLASNESVGGEDYQMMEWAYMFDISEKTYRLIAGAELKILEKKDGDSGKDKYPWIFENLEGKKEAYIPVSNFMCIPAEEGIYDVGICAYIYDLSIVFRRTINQVVGQAEQNVLPHTLVNIPEGQEDAFFNLWEMANQMGAAGQTPIIPITYNPNNPAGNISSAQPILNGGDVNLADKLMERLDDEMRKCGVYLDEPISADLTEMQIQQFTANASVLPKSIMKYNAPEIEFEIMVFIDMLKKYLKSNDKTPLILDTTVELPDGQYSIRGIPFSFGWLKEKLNEKAWRVVCDVESGARTNDNMLLSLYKGLLVNMQPGSPEYQAIQEKVALVSGVKTKGSNPATQALAAQQAAPGGQAMPSEGGAPPLDTSAQAIPPQNIPQEIPA